MARHAGREVLEALHPMIRRLLLCGCVGVLLCANQTLALRPFGTSDSNTSEYALGSYVWNVIFLEDANETFNASQLSTRKTRIMDAAAYWVNQSAQRLHPGARLSIQVNFTNDGDPVMVDDVHSQSNAYVQALNVVLNEGDPVIFEPPTDPPIFEPMGEPGGEPITVTSAWSGSRLLNNMMRDEHDKNWSFTTFVRPFDGRASAFLGGPYTNAYLDDGSYTYAHEAGHIFGALDEYAGANPSTDERGGYLYTYNTNSALLPDGSNNPNSHAAIMRNFGNWTLSSGTLNAIGWRDTDGDTVPDILDTVPAMTTNGSHSIVGQGGEFHLTGNGDVTPLPSPHPNEGDYTINTLAKATYSINGGPEIEVPALDGAWGGYNESFQLDLTGLAPGDYDLSFRLYNSVDNYAEDLYEFLIGLIADFNGNFVYDAGDIDSLRALIGIGLYNEAYDVNGDSAVNNDDLDAWLHNLADSEYGDTDLDQTVSLLDLNTIGTNFGQTGGWAKGDFTGDNQITLLDLNLFGIHFGFDHSGAAPAVPEPTALALLGLMACALGRRRRR